MCFLQLKEGLCQTSAACEFLGKGTSFVSRLPLKCYIYFDCLFAAWPVRVKPL